jgi:hypothetical protein
MRSLCCSGIETSCATSVDESLAADSHDASMLHEAAATPRETTQFSQIPVKRHECDMSGDCERIRRATR